MPREKSTDSPHVRSVFVAKPGHQLLLLRTHTDANQEYQPKTGGKQEPVGRNQRRRAHQQRHAVIERMPHQAIRPVRHHRMHFSRDHRICEIRAKRSERPDEQEHRHGAEHSSAPPQPSRQRHCRPCHSRGIDHERDGAQPVRETHRAQRRQHEHAFLPPVQCLAGGPGLDPKRQHHENDGEHAHDEHWLKRGVQGRVRHRM